MCRKSLFLLSFLLFSLLLPVAIYSVDVDKAKEEIKGALSLLILLEQNSPQEQAILQERMNLTELGMKALEKEKKLLEEDKKASLEREVDLNKRKYLLEKEKINLEERESLIKARETSYQKMSESVETWENDYKTLSWHLTLAKIGLLIEMVLVIIFIVL